MCKSSTKLRKLRANTIKILEESTDQDSPYHQWITDLWIIFGWLFYRNLPTLCACSSLCCVCRSYSSRAHRWYIYDIHGINRQVGQCCGIWRVVYTQRNNVILWVYWVISDFVTDGFSSKIFQEQVTPFCYQTGWAVFVTDDRVRSPKRSWGRLKMI